MEDRDERPVVARNRDVEYRGALSRRQRSPGCGIQEWKEEESAREWSGYPGYLRSHSGSGAHSEFVWSHWERGADGLQAVFRYVVPQAASHFEVNFCCLADPDGTISLSKIAAYHGEVAIDPASGAILRVTVDAHLEPRLPMLSSAIMVEYGPVVIGEKTYICPTRSVSISRWRGVSILTEWGQTIGVYGRFKTMLNDMTFSKYHIFRAQSRVLPDYTPVPK